MSIDDLEPLENIEKRKSINSYFHSSSPSEFHPSIAFGFFVILFSFFWAPGGAAVALALPLSAAVAGPLFFFVSRFAAVALASGGEDALALPL